MLLDKGLPVSPALGGHEAPVEMTESDSKGIGGVKAHVRTIKFEQGADHELDLFLRCIAVPNDGFLDLPRRILGGRKLLLNGGEHRYAPRMTQLQGRLRVLSIEGTLDRALGGCIACNDVPKLGIDALEALRQGSLPGVPDGPAGKYDKSPPPTSDDSVARRESSGVDPQNDRARLMG